MFTKGLLVVLLIAHVTASKEPVKKSWHWVSPLAECAGPYPEDECTAPGIAAGDYVVDPYDCHNYYVCVTVNENSLAPSDHSVSCPDGQWFDNSLGQCATDTETCLSVCTRTCPAKCTPGAIVGKVGDCSKYYYCPPGSDPVEISCSTETPYFDGSKCVNDPSACCDFCSPYCEGEGVQIVDPLDCSKFYICLKAGIASEDTHFQCQTGQSFNSTLGRCVNGTDCQSVCQSSTTVSVAGTTTSTTTTTTGNQDVCVDTYSCTVNGNFPRCPFCDPSYFHCYGGVETILYCSSSRVFNTEPTYPYCVPSAQCPTLG